VNNVEKIGLFPIGQKDINCGVAVFAATVLASAAGIGGGAVLVPLFTLLGEFTEHEARPTHLHPPPPEPEPEPEPEPQPEPEPEPEAEAEAEAEP